MRCAQLVFDLNTRLGKNASRRLLVEESRDRDRRTIMPAEIDRCNTLADVKGADPVYIEQLRRSLQEGWHSSCFRW